MKTKTARNILMILLAFLGVSTIGGGGALIISPSGKLLGGLPLSILEHSPFTDYIAFALIIWIQVETIFVQSVGWLQTFYMQYQ